MNNDELLLTNIPDIKGRYIVLDTETTGLYPNVRDHIISLAGIEIIDGRLTGLQFQGYIQPRVFIGEGAISIHKLNNNFYSEYFKDTYKSDFEVLNNFRKFVDDSLVFAHNATFDYQFLYKEFKQFNIPPIEKSNFRCTMKIFKKVFSEVDPTLKANVKLSNCCNYLGIKAMNENYHNALYDAYMCARLICFIFDFKNIKTQQNSLRKKSNDEKSNKEKSNVSSNYLVFILFF